MFTSGTSNYKFYNRRVSFCKAILNEENQNSISNVNSLPVNKTPTIKVLTDKTNFMKVKTTVKNEHIPERNSVSRKLSPSSTKPIDVTAEKCYSISTNGWHSSTTSAIVCNLNAREAREINQLQQVEILGVCNEDQNLESTCNSSSITSLNTKLKQSSPQQSMNNVESKAYYKPNIGYRVAARKKMKGKFCSNAQSIKQSKAKEDAPSFQCHDIIKVESPVPVLAAELKPKHILSPSSCKAKIYKNNSLHGTKSAAVSSKQKKMREGLSLTSEQGNLRPRNSTYSSHNSLHAAEPNLQTTATTKNNNCGVKSDGNNEIRNLKNRMTLKKQMKKQTSFMSLRSHGKIAKSRYAYTKL